MTRVVAAAFSVTFLPAETRRGSAFASNRGGKLATGYIILLLDADVRVRENTLRKVWMLSAALSIRLGRSGLYLLERVRRHRTGLPAVAADRKITLDRGIEVTQLKRWTFWNLVKTDIVDRGIPGRN